MLSHISQCMQILTNHYHSGNIFFVVVVGIEASWQTLSVCPSAVGQIHSKELVSNMSELTPSNKNHRSFKSDLGISEKALKSVVRFPAQRWESSALPAPAGRGHLARALRTPCLQRRPSLSRGHFSERPSLVPLRLLSRYSNDPQFTMAIHA